MGKSKRKKHEPMEYLRAWRESLGLSRPAVAAKIQVLRPDYEAAFDQATLAKWESGETAVRSQDLMLLAEVYGVTADRLFYAPGDKETPELMRQLWEVATTRHAEAVRRWLALGQSLPGARPGGDFHGESDPHQPANAALKQSSAPPLGAA